MAFLLLVVGISSTLGTYFYVRGEATGAIDTQLRQIAHFIASSDVARSSADITIDAPNPEDLYLIEVWDKNGQLLRSSHRATNLAMPKLGGLADTKDNGQNWRSYVVSSPLTTVRVSLPADVSDEQASNAAFQVALPAALVIPLSWLLLSFIIDRIFAPLDRAARRISSARSETIAAEKYPKEVAPFIGSINKLVSRLHGQVDQQRQFLSSAAHELRTPLTAISLQINNLRKFAKTKPLMARIDSLEAGSKRANQLVNRLLELARLDSGASRAPLQSENINTIVKQSIIQLTPLAQDRKIAFNFHSLESVNVHVPYSEASSIIETLLENAILYSNTKGVVDLTLDVKGSAFQLSIKDIGIGIDPKKLTHIFDRFYRAAPTKADGTGLGLALAKAYADALGWHISIANRDDGQGVIAILKGNSFSI